MNVRRTTAIGLAAAGLVAAAVAVLSPTTATGVDKHPNAWTGQTFSSRAEALRAGKAGAPNTLTLLERNNQNSAVNVDVNNDGFGPGDYLVLNLRLYNKAGTTKVGRGSVKCDFGIQSQTCYASLLIFQKGAIQVIGTTYVNREKFVLSIVGGTDQYRGAGGLVRVVQDPPDQFLMLHFTN
jgi:hypothetical protein